MSEYDRSWEKIREVRERLQALSPHLDTSSLDAALKGEERARESWDKAFGARYDEAEALRRLASDRLFRRWRALEQEAAG